MAYTTIDNPFKHFNTVLYTGNGSTNAITGAGFQPDWVWLKQRSGSASSHKLYDAVRGTTKYIASNNTGAEGTESGVTSFDSDGFTLGSAGGTNTNSATYVSWNWLGANGTVSNSDGSVTTSVSVNQTAGFSIVTYTLGSGTGSTTQGHGLGAVPHVIINKPLDQTYNWQVYHHKNTSAPETERLLLNDSAATEDNNKPWNDTAPTSSVFTHGDSSWNGTGDHVAYCFTEKQGYSKFGSYTGNGSTDGVFIYTGFRPAWIMGKRTDSANNWYIFDSTRSTFNVTDKKLRADQNAAENVDSSKTIDILSNGFKIKSSDAEFNASSGSYIYMAFAEHPFVTAGTKAAGTAR